MNRINRVLSAMLFVLVICSGCLGSDDSAVVILISSKEELISFRDKINDGNPDYYAILTDNIDLQGVEWTPIGIDADYPYSGVFNGNGKTIYNLEIDSDINNQGLFGYLDGGYISNLTLDNPSVKAGSYVGAICGRVGTEGYIYVCSVTGGSVEGVSYVGGIVGDASYSPLLDCYNDGTPVTASESFVGGVAGYSSTSTVTNCYNKATIEGGDNAVGGVIGQAYGSTLIACYNEGEVTGYKNYVGGVAGRISSTMIACYNLAEVSGEGAVGGVVGYATNFYPSTAETYVISCYNTGLVSGTTNVGGVIGETEPSATVTSCYFLTGSATLGIGDDEFADAEEVADVADVNTSAVITAMNLAILAEDTINTSFLYQQGSTNPTLSE